MNRASFLESWAGLCAELGAPADTGHRLGLDLAARHAEPQRHYHTVDHIEAVLDHLETLHLATPVARLTAFFHDAVYDPRASDNEERSAVLAESSLADLGVEQQAIADVATIIRATTAHALPENPPREAAGFLDADLAILGAEPDVYDTYADNIRLEYAHVADDDFRNGRGQILQNMLARPQLYFTSAGQLRWEVSARRNIERELEVLAQR